MQELHKGRQNSEAKRKSLLVQVAVIRTEAVKLGAEAELLECIDTLEQTIRSARVSVKRYRDFLHEENKQVEIVRKTVHALQEKKRKDRINQVKISVLILLLGAIPTIFINKMYYLSLVPKHIPISSAIIYMSIGDILFYLWIILYIPYSIAYRYITVQYIEPFIKNNPPLKIPTRFASASTFIVIYGQFLFYSASLVPRLISPSWGPSVVNVFHLIIAMLTSSPIAAITVLITIWPLVGSLLKKRKQLFHPRKRAHKMKMNEEGSL